MKQEAELVAKLEALKRMFQSLVDRSTGTNVIEAEMMKIIREILVGPTGHSALLKDQDRVNQSMQESELNAEKETTARTCWRDPQLARTLTKMRLKTVKGQLGKARSSLADTMRIVTTTSKKSEAREAWEFVKTTKKEVWKQENSRLQRKVEHLTVRSLECGKHNKFRELDKIWQERKTVVDGENTMSLHRLDTDT